ncbi:pentatricopeptide repeat-containing protein At4g21065-like [Benincasa hispida]|uniref:pentatricopeptide repeat-containing protein At4g21065-like n=1 Tax=Benincasa hispida TaxID=102211 RepID=UPI001901551E|nr:pentatricopeptide repeat-containing protein At4g21065-like [Benincasa hispida]
MKMYFRLLPLSCGIIQRSRLQEICTILNSVILESEMSKFVHTQAMDLPPPRTNERKIPDYKDALHKEGNDVRRDGYFLMKLIDDSVSHNGFESIALIFSKFRSSINSQLCNSMIRGYLDLNKHLNSLYIFAHMHKFSILPDSSTFPAVLKATAQLCDTEVGKMIHGTVIQMGFIHDVYTSTALVHMYCACLSISDASRVFDEMPERNAVTWNALITGYTHNRKFMEAINAFRGMLAAGAEPSERTMVVVLSACSHLGALNQGKWVHEFIYHNRLRLNVFVGTALIDMYAKCGAVDEAEKVFEEIREKNVYTWNVLISGYAMNGQGDAALAAFSRMLMENFKPDEVTFLGILCACCHQGLVTEGRRQFMSMKQHFGLQPKIEHYGCMVDLLGRAGFLDEALELIQSMSMEPDPIIWRALLCACRVHGNTKLGEYTIRRLIELEPNNGENYVLLSNLYSREQRWAEVGKLRGMMSLRGIGKVPGCSSIEINNVVYEFAASNDRKPEFEAIYKQLDNLSEKLKENGYVTGTDMALYDIEKEEKEHSVMYHSEKLALAFGLLNSPLGCTLRIVKNLRICLDCHEFFKVVSIVYQRYIVVRDRNRFHHFSEGFCSCRDYW